MTCQTYLITILERRLKNIPRRYECWLLFQNFIEKFINISFIYHGLKQENYFHSIRMAIL